MASSGKTGHLQLNSWLGSDKPKKDDFNSDNRKIDEAYRLLSEAHALLEAAISAHQSDAVRHVTAAERSAWNAKDKFTTGSWVGDNAQQRRIQIGFRPRFGLVFAVGKFPEVTVYDPGNTNYYSGFFGSVGCSAGLSLDATGLNVQHQVTGAPTGLTYKYNETGVTYIYIAWA